jgi:hypothetical protein
MRLPFIGTRKRSFKSVALSDEIVAMLGARIAHRWGAPDWSVDRLLAESPLTLLRCSAARGGVVCAFVDLPYLGSFGARLVPSFAAAHRDSAIGLHLHLYRTNEAEVERMLAGYGLASAPWLGLSLDSEAAPIYRGRRNLANYYITARYILLERLLAAYGRPLALIDADVEIRRDLAGFFAAMSGVDVALIQRGEGKLAWRRLLAAAVLVNDTPASRRFARHLAECLADDIWSDLPISLDALYLHFCHQAALARGDVRFGSIPPQLCDHGLSPDAWIWHRKGERKRTPGEATSAAPA